MQTQPRFSTANDSVNTMATADLQTHSRPGAYHNNGYNMGDYQHGGGSPAPYGDYSHQQYQTGYR